MRREIGLGGVASSAVGVPEEGTYLQCEVREKVGCRLSLQHAHECKECIDPPSVWRGQVNQQRRCNQRSR